MSCEHRASRLPGALARSLSLWLAAAALLPPGAARAEEPSGSEALQRSLDRYESAGRELVAACSSDDARSDQLAERARALIDLSRQLLGPFAVEYPPCGPYLRAAMGVLDRLASIDVDELERDYHADGALPQAPGFCYNAKDLLVHPATVVVLARSGDGPEVHRRMAAEMQEALTHLAAVRYLMRDD